MKAVLDYLEGNSERFLDELKDFLRIPSISTDDQKTEDVRKAAEYVCSQLKSIGMNRVELFPTGGHPIVYAEWVESQDLPTVLVYGHYDVQPVDPLELWESDPFEPRISGNEIYARGATDDKGQMFIHFKGAEAFLSERGRLPVNLKFLIEGEEEIGSMHLDGFVDEHLEMLKTDVVMISDTAMFSAEVPSICYGLRGLAYMEVEVQGPRGDLHSGSYGGPVGNPALVLAEILASLRDEEGRVTIPGFYDHVLPLTRREREEWAALPFDEAAFKGELGVKALGGEAGFTPLEQLWSRPTLDVNGLLSGFVGEGAKTVLPAKAMAKVSMRLVPNQDFKRIERLFQEYVLSIAPPSVEVTVRALHGGKPWVASLDHPALVTVGNAIEKGFGKRPVFQREGGSIPIVAKFTETLGAPCVLMGIGLPGENAHAPNENLNLNNFYKGIKSAAYFLEEFGRSA